MERRAAREVSFLRGEPDARIIGFSVLNFITISPFSDITKFRRNGNCMKIGETSFWSENRHQNVILMHSFVRNNGK